MNLQQLGKELESKKIELTKVKMKYDKIRDEYYELNTQIESLEEEHKEKENYELWKSMIGKYYHVWLFTVSEEDKFKRCQYVHVLKVEKDLLEYEYINIDERSKNSDFIAISKFDFCHDRGYKAWTEITKKEYEDIIKSKNPERLE